MLSSDMNFVQRHVLLTNKILRYDIQLWAYYSFEACFQVCNILPHCHVIGGVLWHFPPNYHWEFSKCPTFLLTGGEVIHYYYSNKVCYDYYWHIFNSLRNWACWKQEPRSIHILIPCTYHNMGSIDVWKDKVIFPGISKICIT